MSRNSLKSVLIGFKRCLDLTPLPVLSLVIYTGLPSSIIFPDGQPVATDHQPLWQSSYLGWYDLLFLSSVVISFALGSLKLSKANLIFIWTMALIILLSFINGLTLGTGAALDAVVYLFRFALAFSVSVWLVRCLGSQAVESLIIFLFIILSITAVFVYSLQFRNLPRLYASGLGISGFSGVAVIVCFISLIRKYKFIFWIALVLLILTFSKTSILVFFFFLICGYQRLTGASFIKYLILIPSLFYLIVFILIQVSPARLTVFFSLYTAPDYVFSWSGRIPIWQYALHLLQSGNIPLLGVGFNAASSLFEIDNITFVEEEVTYYYQHFHSILIEYGFGLGISSVFILFLIIRRIWQTFQSNCYLSFLIFSFFFITQSIDFNFCRPKEIIIWSLILGLAEGQWRFDRG